MNDKKADPLQLRWDERILELLACPACRGTLRPEADAQRISCVACARVYPVEDGIPVLIVERTVLST